MGRWVRVASLAECPAGALRGITVEGTSIVLTNVDGKVCALEDRCSHEDLPLSDGELQGATLICRYHGARFDACSGARKSLPAVRPVRAYPVEVRDGEIHVEIET